LLLTVSGVSCKVAQFRKDNKDSEDNVRKFHKKEAGSGIRKKNPGPRG
jgi:hypothetical protein